MATNLEAQTLDSGFILLVERGLDSTYRKLPGYTDTPSSVREAISAGKEAEIPPIVSLKNPFPSIDKAKEAYAQFKEQMRPGDDFYRESEQEVLEEILACNPVICYNGNRRLTEFQKAGKSIQSYVISSQEEFDQIPEKEKKFSEEGKEQNPVEYEIDQNYILSYLVCLEFVVHNQAVARHQDRVLEKLKSNPRS